MVPIREPKTYSIVLADDLTLVREGLAALCNAQPHFRVVGQFSEGAAALKLIQAQQPDLAVLDMNLVDLFALEIVRRVRDAGLSENLMAKLELLAEAEAIDPSDLKAAKKSLRGIQERRALGDRLDRGNREPQLRVRGLALRADEPPKQFPSLVLVVAARAQAPRTRCCRCTLRRSSRGWVRRAPTT